MNSLDKTFKPIRNSITSEPEYATLTLYSWTATQISNFNTIFIWRNFSLKQCLGTLYPKYTKFSIQLTQISSSLADAALGATTTTDMGILFQLSGLNFINSNIYNRTILTTLRLARNTTQNQILSRGSGAVFENDTDLHDLAINLTNFVGGDLITTVNYPHFTMVLLIYPISGSESEGFR
jgi:hypothetical protein